MGKAHSERDQPMLLAELPQRRERPTGIVQKAWSLTALNRSRSRKMTAT